MDNRKDKNMLLKILGVIFVVFSCGSVGFKMAANYKKEEKTLQNLLRILDYISAELQYRLTPLPQLCRQISQLFSDSPGYIFEEIANEMELQYCIDPSKCMEVVLNKIKHLPQITRKKLKLLSETMGRFDVEGQLKEIDAVRKECENSLKFLRDNHENRIRSYQTLGLCAGAALAILFV